MKIKEKSYPYVDEENELVYFNENTIVSQFVNVVWSGFIKKHYIKCGYNYTRQGDKFLVNTMDLPKGSHAKVTVICIGCGDRREAQFRRVMSRNHSKCRSCSKIKDLTGLVIGRWTVIKVAYEYVDGYRKPYIHGVKWWCKCECGSGFFKVRAGALIAGVSKSCGCISTERRKKAVGDKNPAWKPHLTDKDRENRRSNKDNTDWAKVIKSRDKYTCQCCKRVSGDLVSHHLNGYRDFPEQRTDLNNGVTLCEKCHIKFHSNFMGHNRIKCTRSDFIKFLLERYPTALFLQNSDNLTD